MDTSNCSLETRRMRAVVNVLSDSHGWMTQKDRNVDTNNIRVTHYESTSRNTGERFITVDIWINDQTVFGYNLNSRNVEVVFYVVNSTIDEDRITMQLTNRELCDIYEIVVQYKSGVKVFSVINDEKYTTISGCATISGEYALQIVHDLIHYTGVSFHIKN